MKKIITYGIVALFTTLALETKAQSPYKLEVEQEVIGSDLHMSLYATKLSGDDFSFGSSNFAVIIDTANLDINNMTKLEDGIWDNDIDPQSYLDVFLGKGPNFINVSTRRNTSGNGSGQLLTSNKTLVAKIAIPIKNECTTNTSEWVVLPAAQNKFPVTDIKKDAEFVNPLPDFPLCEAPDEPNLVSNGNDTICEGDVVELSTNVVGEVKWYRDGMELIGEDESVLVTGAPGNYTVEAINCICKTMSSTVKTITVNPLPETPIISQNGNTLQVDPTDAEIIWYKNGDVIVTNTTMLTNLDEGVYAVMFKNECGNKLSESVEIKTTSISEQLVTGLSASPNPFNESTQIKVTLAESKDVSLVVYNMLGGYVATLLEGRKSAGEYVVSFNTVENQASDGVYLVKLLIDEDEAQVLKVVEIK